MPMKKPAPGDDLLRLAQKEGVSYQAIRGHAENRDLFAARDPAVLSPEDELFIPAREPKQVPVSRGETHYIVYKPATRVLHLALRDEHGSPRQTDYTLSDFQYDAPKPKYGLPFPDRLYGFAYQGVIREELPAAIAALKLTLEDAPDDPLDIQLGRLDPASTTRGLKARLQSLGLYDGDLDSPDYDSGLSAAVKAFQRAHGLPVTGAADGSTRQQLKSVCGG